MKDMIKMGLFLFITSAIAGVLLACTQAVTAPKIAENKRIKLEKAKLAVLPEAVVFENVKIDGKTNKKGEFSAGFNKQNQLVGIVCKVSPIGYGGPIEMVLGVKKNGRISGVKILSLKETPGLGTKLKGSKFMSNFKELITDKAAPIFKVKKDGGQVDAITAATISSRAFCRGIQKGISIYKSVKSKFSSIKAPEKIKKLPGGGAK